MNKLKELFVDFLSCFDVWRIEPYFERCKKSFLQILIIISFFIDLIYIELSLIYRLDSKLIYNILYAFFLAITLGLLKFNKVKLAIYTYLVGLFALFTGYLFKGFIHVLFWFHLIPVVAAFFFSLPQAAIISLVAFFLEILGILIALKDGRIDLPAQKLNYFIYDAFLSYIAITVTILIFKVFLDRYFETVQHILDYDPLTRVFNRRKILHELEKEYERSKRFKQPLSILMIDIDHFKRVNDTYGHLVGDLVLQKVAKVIKNSIRKIDLVGRYGGEEFLVILPGTPLQGAVRVAERIRKKIEEENFPIVGHITVSVGAAELREYDDIESLIHRADEKLYEAKKSGRNRVKF